MVSYTANELYYGLKIIQDGEPCIIIDNEFVKPGKGQAFNRVRLRQLLSGKLIEKIFKSGDSVNAADVVDINLAYLYNDGRCWHFINNKTFEQLAVDISIIGKNAKWLVKQVECILTFWNSQPISITPPNFVELQVTDTHPGLKGDTVGTCNKPAILTTGAIVKVPLFIHIGDIIKIDTRSGEYVSRIK
ncbi:elongation factor P [Candidatus Curculioniphilus buchneri]|uniref:elongation factor P n=1 Tax=Candidatus Curculioniphilus buchneri TaxID=690594 RepID=UPI00376F2B04